MKIAICFPTHDYTKARFTLSLAAMSLLVGSTLNAEVVVMNGEGALPDVRNELAQACLDQRADFQLCLDADHSFPKDVLHRLLAHNLDIVGCNYPRRRNPPGLPTALVGGRALKTTAESPPLQEVDGMGMGLCLIRTEVYRKLPEPWFTFPILGNRHGSEDLAFFEAARGAGYKVYVDHTLSMEVGHLAETELRFPR